MPYIKSIFAVALAVAAISSIAPKDFGSSAYLGATSEKAVYSASSK